MGPHRPPSPAVAISLVALFVSLGGTGYAALTITGKNVRDGSLTGKDLKNRSLTGVDVKNGSLAMGDFKAGQLPPGPQGLKGDPGPQGPRGESAPPPEPVRAVAAASGADNCPASTGEFCAAPAEEWRNVGVGFQPGGFFKDGSGFVHLQGSIRGETTPTWAFFLPPGYRPSASRVFLVHDDGGVNFVVIGSDGGVDPGGVGGTPHLSLDGITFRP